MGIPHVGHNEPVCGEEERGARVEVDFFWVVRGARLEDTVGRGRDNARAAMGGDRVGARQRVRPRPTREGARRGRKNIRGPSKRTTQSDGLDT